MSIPHIVMVEDNLPDVMVFREALARRGIAFTIQHFADGEQAANAIAKMAEGPDLFVLDLNLPRVDGLTLLRQIREASVTSRTPVAVLTTSQAAADRARCEALGVDAFVVKPGDFTEFVDLVGGTVQLLLSKAVGGGVRESSAQGSTVTAEGAQRRLLRLAAILSRLGRRASGKARAAGSPE